METEIENNYCNHLRTIPQFSGTCWFNSIINVMLYSNGFRKVLKKEFKGKRKTTDDKFFNFLLYMLRNSNNTGRMAKVYEDFNNLSLKVEYLLISYLQKYDIPLYNYIKRSYNYGISSLSYICNVLTSYNIRYLDIYFNREKEKEILLIDKDNRISNIKTDLDNIDLLIISYDKPYGFTIEQMNELAYSSSKIGLKKGISNFSKVYDQIKKTENTIKINQYSYNLDSCLFRNINKLEEGGHAIAGITCPNNNKYIIDSINNRISYNDYKNNKVKEILNPCRPLLYDWTTLDKDFCIDSSSCDKIEFVKNKEKLCYNFSESNLVCIYVKNQDNSINISSSDDIDEPSLISHDFKYDKKKISVLIKNNIYDYLKTYNIEELKKFIHENISKYYKQDLIDIQKNPNEYHYLYEKITNKKINLKLDNYNVSRTILLNLIYSYLKNGTIYIIYKYTDKLTIEKYVKYYLSKSIKELKTYFDIDSYDKSMLARIHEYLFKENKDFYDKYILKINSDREDIKLKQLLVKLIIIKRLYKKIKIEKKIREYINGVGRSRSRSRTTKSSSIITNTINKKEVNLDNLDDELDEL
jgi:hypothetical protein